MDSTCYHTHLPSRTDISQPSCHCAGSWCQTKTRRSYHVMYTQFPSAYLFNYLRNSQYQIMLHRKSHPYVLVSLVSAAIFALVFFEPMTPKKLGCHGILFLLLKLIVHVVDVNGVDLGPSIFRNVEEVIDSSRCCITESGMVNGSLSQINGFFHRQIRAVSSIQHTIG